MIIDNTKHTELIHLINKGEAIYIEGNVPSQKNSKQILRKFTNQCLICGAEVKMTGKGKTRKHFCPQCKKYTSVKTIPFIDSSEQVKKYKAESKPKYLAVKELFEKLTANVEKPYILGYFYLRGSHHKFDYSNLVEVIQDSFTEYGFWEDDNTDNTLPVPLGYAYSKKRAGVIILVLNDKLKLDI